MTTQITQEPPYGWRGDFLGRLNRQCSAWLNEMLKTPGVKNACLCDNRGNVLGALVNDAYAREDLQQVGQLFVQIFGALNERGGKPKEIEFFYERAKVVVRDMGEAFGFVILALNTNASLVRMAINVSSAAFEADTVLQQLLRNTGSPQQESSTSNNASEGSWARFP